MKISCGTDIIEIERIKQSIIDMEEMFLERIYTKKEIQYCESKKQQKYQHYAARFAAKEAIFKAISSKLESKYAIGWKNIEVINDDNGRPHIYWIDIKIKELEEIDISISHCKTYATANVVAVWKE